MRTLTRGLGERTVAKNIRTATYPQLGLRENIVPDPQNISVVDADITAITVVSLSRPFRIDSAYTAPFPFLKLYKGESSFGIKPKQTSYTAFGLAESGGYSYVKEPLWRNKHSIASFGTPIGFGVSLVGISPSRAYLSQTAISFTGVPVIQEWRKLNVGFPQNISVGTTDISRFEFSKGGIKNTVSQMRGMNIFDYTRFNRVTTTFFVMPQENTSLMAGLYNFTIGNIELYGYLTYSEGNTLKSNNAAWLLNQRTQYRRKFNPLKNLGV